MGETIVLDGTIFVAQLTVCHFIFLVPPKCPQLVCIASRQAGYGVWNIRFGLIDLPYQSGLVSVPSTLPQDESFIINVCTYIYRNGQVSR